MGPSDNRQGEGPPQPAAGRLWVLPLLALAAWQCWLTLTLFGTSARWQHLTDDRPVVSGRHPLHLYHGRLGARSLLRRGSLSCYDPAFQAGYPKTPVFDSGSRPAELFLALAGGGYNPAAYKIGLAICCLLAPLALTVAARGVGLNHRATFFAVLFGLLVWWGECCQRALAGGEVDLLLATLSALALAGLLVRFDRKPRWGDWLGVLLAALAGWFSHPLFFTALLPLFLAYYLCAGVRHRAAWSVVLLAGLMAAVACNFFWMADWVRYWWLRVPLEPSLLLLPHRTPATLWRADLWGAPADRTLACLLVVATAAGAALLRRAGKRTAARLFGLGSLGLVVVALGGILTEPLARLNSPVLLLPGLLFGAPLAALAVERGWQAAARATGRPWLLGLTTAALVLAAGFAAREHLAPWRQRAIAAAPLDLGLSPEQRCVVEQVTAYTSDEARILWENRPHAGASACWTPLLPLLTGRSFVGGLDSEGSIEHTAGGLSGNALDGRPLDEWTDGELGEYCRRYNIGWVVCWSAGAVARFDRWPRAERTLSFRDRDQGCLFTIRRARSYFLKGKGRWLRADAFSIALADLEPEDGEVVLSLHYQEGFRVSPSRVRVEKELDPRDPIPLTRLRVDAPVARLTLTWRK